MSRAHWGKAWQKARHAAKERDSWRCQSCGKAGVLEVHHVQSVRDGGSDDMSNLQTLCVSCHVASHRRPRSRQQTEWEALIEELL